jgi:hypothetical protein
LREFPRLKGNAIFLGALAARRPGLHRDLFVDVYGICSFPQLPLDRILTRGLSEDLWPAVREVRSCDFDYAPRSFLAVGAAFGVPVRRPPDGQGPIETDEPMGDSCPDRLAALMALQRVRHSAERDSRQSRVAQDQEMPGRQIGLVAGHR